MPRFKTLKTSTVELDKEIGASIRQFRLHRSMSQEALAEKIGVTFQQLQKYEKGLNRVSTSALILICRALDITPKEVLGVYFEGDSSPLIQELLEAIGERDRKLQEIQSVLADQPGRATATARKGRLNHASAASA
jgi:transcriptional regulator with XRE-family HTH domain